MWGVIKEIGVYLAFLALTSFIAWGPMDDTVYVMNNRIKGLYNGGNGTFKYTKVNTGRANHGIVM